MSTSKPIINNLSSKRFPLKLNSKSLDSKNLNSKNLNSKSLNSKTCPRNSSHNRHFTSSIEYISKVSSTTETTMTVFGRASIWGMTKVTMTARPGHSMAGHPVLSACKPDLAYFHVVATASIPQLHTIRSLIT
jgi:hypothetical protein